MNLSAVPRYVTVKTKKDHSVGLVSMYTWVPCLMV